MTTDPAADQITYATLSADNELIRASVGPHRARPSAATTELSSTGVAHGDGTFGGASAVDRDILPDVRPRDRSRRDAAVRRRGPCSSHGPPCRGVSGWRSSARGDLIRRLMEQSADMALGSERTASRLLGEVEESADLLRYYARPSENEDLATTTRWATRGRAVPRSILRSARRVRASVSPRSTSLWRSRDRPDRRRAAGRQHGRLPSASFVGRTVRRTRCWRPKGAINLVMGPGDGRPDAQTPASMARVHRLV
jgi:hypothetical protein